MEKIKYFSGFFKNAPFPAKLKPTKFRNSQRNHNPRDD